YPELYNPEAYVRLDNPLYVALTRATERLYLVQDFRKGVLPFVNGSLLQKFCDVKVLAEEQQQVDGTQLLEETSITNLTCTITQLLRNIPEKAATECIQHLELKELIPPGSEVRRKPVIGDKY